MRLAVFSDVHGNLEAFTAVLADLDAQAPDAAACLGDAIGYGPDPEACVELIRRRAVPMVLGNHELGLVRCQGLARFNPHARCALDATARLLSPEAVAWLDTLPKSLVLSGVRLAHGCPPDSAQKYLFEQDEDALLRLFARYPERLCCVGHTHIPELVELRGGALRRHELVPGPLALRPDSRYILCVGSVGQPRDDVSRDAKYVILDLAGDRAELRAVPYDPAPTAEKIRARGLPQRYAERLF